jgi:hypothetical protein
MEEDPEHMDREQGEGLVLGGYRKGPGAVWLPCGFLLSLTQILFCSPAFALCSS